MQQNQLKEACKLNNESRQIELVVLQLPENSPKRGMSFYRPTEGDTFCFINESVELEEEFAFEKDEKGKVYSYKDQGNYRCKINR
jgi:hypothetical protein